MSKARKTLLYSAYFIASAAVFLYYLFPSAAVVKQIELSVKRADPELDIAIDHVAPAFPPGLSLIAAQLRYRNQVLCKADRLRIAPKWMSLLTKDNAFYFTGRAQGGKFDGQIELTGADPDYRVDGKLNLSGIQLESLSVLNDLTQHRISGLLDAKIEYNGDDSSQNATAYLMLRDCIIGLQPPVFKLQQIEFKSVTANLILEDQTLTITDCDFKGDQVNGSISGSVDLAQVPAQSILNLSGTLQPHSQFVAELRKSVPIDMILANRPGENGFGFQVEGSLDNPHFALK